MVWIDDALVEILRYLPDQREAAAMSGSFLMTPFISLRSNSQQLRLPFVFLRLFCLFSSGFYFEKFEARNLISW